MSTWGRSSGRRLSRSLPTGCSSMSQARAVSPYSRATVPTGAFGYGMRQLRRVLRRRSDEGVPAWTRRRRSKRRHNDSRRPQRLPHRIRQRLRRHVHHRRRDVAPRQPETAPAECGDLRPASHGHRARAGSASSATIRSASRYTVDAGPAAAHTQALGSHRPRGAPPRRAAILVAASDTERLPVLRRITLGARGRRTNPPADRSGRVGDGDVAPVQDTFCAPGAAASWCDYVNAIHVGQTTLTGVTSLDTPGQRTARPPESASPSPPSRRRTTRTRGSPASACSGPRERCSSGGPASPPVAHVHE